jgi:hypothetical protein
MAGACHAWRWFLRTPSRVRRDTLVERGRGRISLATTDGRMPGSRRDARRQCDVRSRG